MRRIHGPLRAVTVFALIFATWGWIPATAWSDDVFAVLPTLTPQVFARARSTEASGAIELGDRPTALVDDMRPSPLKTQLQACANGPFSRTQLSIGHRGAPLHFPEHTRESYEAAARMGAGVLECDVTFTKDRKLVCRHSQCDLHRTTNILAVPELAAKCQEAFSPARFGMPASARCCTSDITLAELKSLCGKEDRVNTKAKTVAEYIDSDTCATLVSHEESIALFSRLGTLHTPELKEPQVSMPFEGDYTQEQFAQQMIDQYRAAGVPPEHVLPQSFNLDDILYWIEHEPAFGRQAIYLDDRADYPLGYHFAVASLPTLARRGVRIVAPPMWALLELEGEAIVASDYAKAARKAGLDIITWTLERSGSLRKRGGYYYQSVSPVIDREGDVYEVLDALTTQVGIRGIFSDWPATVTYYANCKGL
jgi:glycerophosphoryl diester phosphodiesterase